MAELVLAGEFPAVDREQWSAAVAAALDRNGELSPDAALARLRTTTYDGITIEPLYTAADVPGDDASGFPGARPFVRGRTATSTRVGGWDVRQRVDGAAGAGRALEELERGATSVLLDLRALPAVTADVVGTALEGVLIDMAPVVLDAGERWQDAADAVGEHLRAGSLGADPLGEPGTPDLDSHLDAIAAWIRRLGDGRPDLRVVTIDGTRFHDAGASDAQQLGCAVAAGIEYLRAVDRRGITAAAAIARIELRLAATDDQFATIAMFRAVRRLWARVADAVGAPGATSPVHAVTSRAMMTAYDPWVNALRSTLACFAAGIAGADAVTVLAHDALRGADATELGRRVARNTQSILLLESHLDDVIDPAGGSWYVERFTDQLADAAWAWCQEIELAGGFRAAGALIAERIAATRTARQRDIDTRRAPLTGLSAFPNVTEPAPPPVPSTDGHRWSEGFEALRRRVDAVTPRPSVFLATIGPAAVFTPRVTFARNVFKIAGLSTLSGPVTDDPAEIAAALAASGATVACLCSSDTVYADLGAAVAEALRAAGATVYVAGRPRGLDARPIYASCDVRATLAELLDLMQVP
jgi:methylmalonyl-CoA mutase